MTGKQLSRELRLSETQMPLFRSGKVRGIRFATLERLCAVLECRTSDLIDYEAYFNLREMTRGGQ